MPPRRIVLKKETRMFGAAQVMTGLIHCALGYIWIHLYTQQFYFLIKIYLPITLLSGYPFWASSFFIMSGIFAIEAEKKRSPRLLFYTTRMNIHSAGLSVIGLILIIFEFALFLVKNKYTYWQQLRNFRNVKICEEYGSTFLYLEKCIDAFHVFMDILLLGIVPGNKSGQMGKPSIISHQLSQIITVEIMIGLSNCALGTIWLLLLLIDEMIRQDHLPKVIVIYAFCSAALFVVTGFCCISINKDSTQRKLNFVLVMNIIAVCLAAFGLLIAIGQLIIYSITIKDYVWSHVASNILSEYLLIFSILMISIASTIIFFLKKELHYRRHHEEKQLAFTKELGTSAKETFAAGVSTNMNSMASGDPTTNSVFLVTTQNGYPVVPGIMSQVPLYPSNQPQVHLIPGNPPNLMPYVNEQPAQRALKEGKALGAVQIMIGLIHIGFGSILATALNRYYAAVSFYSGFPFWGGIFFIISGTLSVKAEKEPGSTSLLNASVGMNIISTVFAAVGSVLFITDLNISSTYIHLDYHTHSPYWIVNPGVTISWVLLIFCLLEFCVASTLSHFGSQLTCYQRNNVSMVFSNVCTSNPMVVPEPENPPPEYSVEDPNSK